MANPVHHASIERLKPHPSRRALLGGGLVAVLALILLDGGIAAWAQLTARRQVSARHVAAIAQYSLDRHLLAMLSLSLFTVGLACTLIRTRQSLLAAVLLIAVAAGPMTILAAPVGPALITANSGNTVWWWHTVVQGGQLLILGAWTWWATRCLHGRRIFTVAFVDPALPEQHHGVVSCGLLSGLYVAVMVTAQILTRTSDGAESPGLLVMAGWAMLGAAGAVVVLQSSWWPMSGTVMVGTVLMLGMMYDAYYRPGGWPGVAGWENGLEPPIVLSFSTSACVLAGPLAGTVLRRRHPPSGAANPTAEGESASGAR